MPASPTLDGSVQGNTGGSTTLAVSLTTTGAGIICVAVLCNGGPVTGVAATGLTFTRRARNVATATNTELWYAVSSGAVTAKSITVTQTSSSFMTVTAFGVLGATGWDSNGALPSVIGDGSGNATTSRAAITTTQADNFLIGIYRFHFTSTPDSGTGWTRIVGANFQLVEYKTVSATQTATDVLISTGFNGGNDDQNGGIGDALTSDTNTLPAASPALGVTMAAAMTTDNFASPAPALGLSESATLTLVSARKQPVVCVMT